MNAVSQALYLIRLQKGLSQKELSLRSGIPQPNISNIEKGKDFQVSTLCQLAYALDVSPADLLKGVDAVPVDKHHFFQRDHIEKAVRDLVKNGPAKNTALSPIHLFDSVLAKRGRGQSKKNTYLSWAILKKTFSDQEISAVLSRIEKAKRRLS